jgi:hypothetical protein
MLNYLHNATPLQITARLPANKSIFRVGKTRLGVDPKDARAQLALCCAVSEERLRFGRCIARLKTVPHHQKDIHVTRVGLSGDVTTEDDKSLQKLCTACYRLSEKDS